MSPPISSWKKLIVSGSDAQFTRVFSTSITGSFSGDGTQITNINSASYALTASYALISAAGGGSALSSSVVVESYTFVGNNVTTNYQISKSYSDSSVTVTVGGLTYINPDDYSISGSTIVFVEPPLSSSNISVKALMNVAQNATGSFSGSFAGDGSRLTNISSNTTIDTYTFVGNGATTVYDIVNTYYGNSVFVTVEGLTQTQTLDYTLSSNIVTFLTAPPSESNILVRAFINTTNQSTGSFSGSFLGIVSNATSASYALTASYVANAGVISSSTQFKSLTDPFTGSFTGSFTGNGSGLTGVTSAGTVSSSAQYPGWVTSSTQVLLNTLTGTTFSNNAFYFPTDLRVEGNLTAQQIYTEYVSSSVIYESGSTKFGDTTDDVMSVTGSIRVLGGSISGSMTGMFSASSQVDYNSITNKLSGVVSSSTQFNALSGTSASYASTASVANASTLTGATLASGVTASSLTSVGTTLSVNGVVVGRGGSAVATNTAVGTSALNANTTGQFNTATGYEALSANTTADNNTATGQAALRSNTTGGSNAAFGLSLIHI
jgi:hypothetical protein